MLTCKEATLLASKKLDDKLTWREKINFYLHIMVCHLCRRYAREIKKLHNLINKTGQSGFSVLPESVKLSGKSRHKIKQALDQARRQSENRNRSEGNPF